jgi:pyroglutamyl-peptidase
LIAVREPILKEIDQVFLRKMSLDQNYDLFYNRLMKILVSGFGPFHNVPINPTTLLVEALNRQEVKIPEGMTVDQILLPVDFDDAFDILNAKIKVFNPDVVISFGVASKRETIELEALAINEIDAEIEDNSGKKPVGSKINPVGPDQYESTLPLHGFENVLKNAEIPVKISQSAGKFVCNYLFYKLMEANQESLRLCGFVHVPSLEEIHSIGLIKRSLEIMLHYLRYENS